MIDLLTRLKNHCAIMAPHQKEREAGKLLIEATEEIADLEATFNLRHQADVRAIKLWRQAHPDKPLTLPDHTDLVVWLLKQMEKRHEP